MADGKKAPPTSGAPASAIKHLSQQKPGDLSLHGSTTSSYLVEPGALENLPTSEGPAESLASQEFMGATAANMMMRSHWLPASVPAGAVRSTEGGVVHIDEEHPLGARVTLEENGVSAPWAITCGITGWMVHTALFQKEKDARTALVEMKARLETIVEMIPLDGDPDMEKKQAAIFAAIDDFTDAFPS